MAKMGRPSKLTKSREKTLLESIKIGMPIMESCQLAGISKTTYYNWKEKAEENRKEYVDFLDSLKKAEITAQKNLIKIISLDKSWQSKAWILERRWPNAWGRKDKVDVGGEIKHKVIILPSNDRDD